MELDGIALAGGGLAVLVGEGQDAVFIGPGAQVLDGVGGEPEAVGAVGVEGHLGAAVVGGDHRRLSQQGRRGFRRSFCHGRRRGFRRSFGHGLLCCFLSRLLFLHRGGFILRDGASAEGPDGLGHSIQHRGMIRGIIGAVGGLGVADLVIGGAAHLAGIGIQLQGEDRVGGGGSGDNAVLAYGIGALCLHGGHHAQAGVIADDGALAGLDAVGIAGEGVGVVGIQGQLQGQVQPGVVVHQTAEVAALELMSGHDVQIAFRAGDNHIVGSGHVGILHVAADFAVSQGPDGLGHSIQHRGMIRGVIGAVGGLGVADLVIGGAAHLAGIGIQLQGEDRVGGGGGGDGAVLIHGIGALCLHGGHHAQTGVIADDGALAGLDAVGVAEESIGIVRVQRELQGQVQPGVVVHQAAEVSALELIAGHDLQIAFRAGDVDFIGSRQARSAAAGGRDRGGAGSLGGEHATQDQGGHQDGHADEGAGAQNAGLLSAGLLRFLRVPPKGADDIEDHGGQGGKNAAQGEVDGFLAAVTGVIVGENAVADAFHPVAQEIDRAEGQAGGHQEGQQTGPEGLGKLFETEDRGAFDQQRASVADGHDDRIHLAVDIIAGGKPEPKQDDGQHRQGDGGPAGQDLSGSLLVFHDLCPPFLPLLHQIQDEEDHEPGVTGAHQNG